MRLLFLDVDGVVWNVAGTILARHVHGKECRPSRELDPTALALVGELVEELDFKVVVSSSWRLGHPIEELKEILGPKIGPRIIGVTPHHYNGYRGKEIKEFLDNWNEFYRGARVDDFIILDDDRDMNPFMGHLFWTSSYNGFLFTDYVKVESYMKLSPFRKKIVRFKKMVWYNLSRQYWGAHRTLAWKIRDAIKALTQVGELCNLAKPSADSLPSPSAEKTSTGKSSGTSDASAEKKS